jgi:ABC-type amino acid transport substrate-binding protein
MPKRLGTTLMLSLGVLWACGMGGLPQAARANDGIAEAQDPVDVIWFPNPPYAVNRKGVPAGFEIDLWRMIAETRQIPYRIRKAASFEDLLTAIRTNQADLAISGVLINENRSKEFRFSFPTASSDLKIYTLDNQEPTAIKMLRILVSKQVLLIFLGLALIACIFALPVWFVERKRPDLADKRKRHQLVFILQKTLLLSTDHTQQTRTRLISIGSLFARVLLTAYFTSYILKLATNELNTRSADQMEEVNDEILKNSTFAAIPGYIQTSILKSSGAKTLDCDVAETCITLLQTGKVDAILDDMLTMRSALKTMPPTPKVTPASDKLMTLFMAFAISDQFSRDPRSSAINDGIARSYYDGSHAKLSRIWLKQ